MAGFFYLSSWSVTSLGRASTVPVWQSHTVRPFPRGAFLAIFNFNGDVGMGPLPVARGLIRPLWSGDPFSALFGVVCQIIRLFRAAVPVRALGRGYRFPRPFGSDGASAALSAAVTNFCGIRSGVASAALSAAVTNFCGIWSGVASAALPAAVINLCGLRSGIC